MNAHDFFEELDAKTWQQSIKSKVSHKIDELISLLQSEKENIVSETIKDLSTIEKMLKEEKEEYTYEVFKKWLNKISRDNISKELGE